MKFLVIVCKENLLQVFGNSMCNREKCKSSFKKMKKNLGQVLHQYDENLKKVWGKFE